MTNEKIILEFLKGREDLANTRSSLSIKNYIIMAWGYPIAVLVNDWLIACQCNNYDKKHAHSHNLSSVQWQYFVQHKKRGWKSWLWEYFYKGKYKTFDLCLTHFDKLIECLEWKDNKVVNIDEVAKLIISSALESREGYLKRARTRQDTYKPHVIGMERFLKYLKPFGMNKIVNEIANSILSKL
ncbi:MAG: hypothetical protein WC679_14105 [Bacteroidales bacterium]|jgi:hypothetical protein